MSERVALQPVDAADVTIVIDNSIDLLAASTEQARRPPFVWDAFELEQLSAEHGYSAMLTINRDGSSE